MTIPDIATDTRPNPFNADLATRTLAAIEADPAHWYQGAWISECGTKFCFAGWAVRLHDGVDPGISTPIQSKAETALGIDTWTAAPLFASQNTLQELREMVADYAAAPDMHALDRTALRWRSGRIEDDYYDPEPDQDYWYDEDDL